MAQAAYMSKSDQVQESSNQARPVSDSRSAFYVRNQTRLTQFKTEALNLCHVSIVTMATACLLWLLMRGARCTL